MKKPNAKLYYNPDPAYLRELLAKAGLTQAGAAGLMGMSTAGLQNYIRAPDDPKYRPAPYMAQLALEALAE